MNKEEIKKITETIPSYVSQSEGELLYELAKNCQGKGVIVEIGSWQGRSTVWLGKGSLAGKGAKIYAIDPHKGEALRKNEDANVSTLEAFKNNIKNAGLEKNVELLVRSSGEAVNEIDEPIELIFIDGDHSYEAVKKDFEMWYPKIVNGGVMAFHDTNGRPGPTRLVSEKVHRSRNFKDIKIVGSVTAAIKAQNITLIDRLKNILTLHKKNLFVVLPKRIKWGCLGFAVKLRNIITNKKS